MNRNLVLIGLGGVIIIGAAVLVNKVLVQPEEVVDLKAADVSKGIFKRTSDDPSTEIKFAWKRKNTFVENTSAEVTILPGAQNVKYDEKTVSWQCFPYIKNTGQKSYDQMTVVPLVVQKTTKEILFEGDPVQLREFTNDRWYVPGPLGPGTTSGCRPIQFNAPVDTWRSDSEVKLAIKSLNRLSIPKKIEYPWELYQAMLEDPSLALRTIKANPELLKLKSKDETTPMLMAIASGNLDLVNFIASQGGKWSDTSNTGLTALSYAAMSNSQEMLDLVSKHVKPLPDKAKVNTTPLCDATYQYLENSVLWFARNKIQLDVPNKNGYTPLMLAARNRDRGAVYMLIAGGADVHALVPGGFSIYTICGGDWYCMELLHEVGLEMDKPNKQNSVTPIQTAAAAQDFSAIHWYLYHGLKLETKNTLGKDAWYYFRESNTLKTDRWLKDDLKDPAWVTYRKEWEADYKSWMKKLKAWGEGKPIPEDE